MTTPLIAQLKLHREPPVPNPVLGIDVSGWNANAKKGTHIDWKAVGEAGVQFAYIKVGEGVKNYSRAWTENVVEGDVYEEGFYVGPYWFPRTDHRGRASGGFRHAEQSMINFRDGAECWEPEGWLPPALDFEWHGNDKYAEDKDRVIWAKDLVITTTELFTVKPVLYLPYSYWLYQLDGDPFFLDYPWWYPKPQLISRGQELPRPPLQPVHGSAWEKYVIWQASHTADVPGVPSKNTDLNMWFGTLEELQAFCGDGGEL